ncbi:hypothetical protein AGIG_G4192 [Arapaima gigas]
MIAWDRASPTLARTRPLEGRRESGVWGVFGQLSQSPDTEGQRHAAVPGQNSEEPRGQLLRTKFFWRVSAACFTSLTCWCMSFQRDEATPKGSRVRPPRGPAPAPFVDKCLSRSKGRSQDTGCVSWTYS